MKLYHGSFVEIKTPDLSIGRKMTDFGQGFYLTPDAEMAEKWAARKSHPVINVYSADLEGLSVNKFSADEEWLDFVVRNRNGEETGASMDGVDLIVGPTADDRLFSTIEQYEEGLIPSRLAVKVINNMQVGEQYCFCSERAIRSLKFEEAYTISAARLHELRERISLEREKADALTARMIREYNKR